MNLKVSSTNEANWKDVTISTSIPDALKPLNEIAHNLWWSWSHDAKQLFKDLDPELWKTVNQNPVMQLAKMEYEKLESFAENADYIKQMQVVYKEFRNYIDATPDSSRPSVAYFCMEYGLSHVLKIYSGGLGILAGDYIKEASDSNVRMCAVGFLYRFGYFTQALSMDGDQLAKYEAQNFSQLPIERVMDEDGSPMVLDVPYNNYTVRAYVWQVNVGRVKLYLLDTDNELNSEYDRSITHSLYGGDWENRLKQEILLGIGGVLLLNRLGIKPDLYHCNEGHAALCNVQRIVDFVSQGYTYNQACELVRTTSLYTVHTPVPAGHDYFDEQLFSKYMSNYPEKMGTTWNDFMNMGRTNPDDHNEKFCMSTFACNTSTWVNGVSWLHGEVSKNMFAPIWKGYFPEEMKNVGYVTNGVHFPTWAATTWKNLYGKYLDKNYVNDQSNEALWKNIQQVPDEEIWATRKEMKNKLVKYIKTAFQNDWLRNQGDPSRIVEITKKISGDALTIGFARRFATYKRAHLLFTDLDRLSKIVNNPERPVQFLFAGKAHPHDGGGQGLIKRIYEISRRPEFLGKIIFLENYDMKLARRLVSGVDIWMNTPTRPLEASGTSGEKALMNGVVNLSVKDGWWYEGYSEGAGWALTEKRTYQDQNQQDQLDAATIYQLLENEIVPLYYDRKDGKDYSEGWIQVVKNSIAQIAPHYTMKRQLDDYYERFYQPLTERARLLMADDCKKMKDIVTWKEIVAQRWDEVKVVEKDIDPSVHAGVTGKKYKIRYVIDEQGLDDAVGLEMVTLYLNHKTGKLEVFQTEPLEVVKRDDNLFTFEGYHSIHIAGDYKVACRMYPKNDDLPHRQDFCYVKWIN